MNVNEKVRTLEKITGYPVRPDIYEGDSDKYIVFNYEDERGTLYGDDTELYCTAYLQIALYTPEDFNYMEDKRKIKKELKAQGFNVESIRSWMEPAAKNGTKRVRHTAFMVNITEAEEE